MDASSERERRTNNTRVQSTNHLLEASSHLFMLSKGSFRFQIDFAITAILGAFFLVHSTLDVGVVAAVPVAALVCVWFEEDSARDGMAAHDTITVWCAISCTFIQIKHELELSRKNCNDTTRYLLLLIWLSSSLFCC